MTRKDIDDLWQRYADDKVTPKEKAIMDAAFLKYMSQDETLPTEKELIDADKRIGTGLVYKDIPIKKINWPFRIAAAAAATIICLSIWSLLFVKTPLPTGYVNDINPGGYRATLLLASGTSIDLSNAKNGKIAVDKNIEIIKNADGELIFKVQSDSTTASVVSNQKNSISLNTLSTPKGGQYHIALPDGTNVWLNAASTLKFPSSFLGLANRSVELNGEAYFEVAQVKSLFGLKKRARKQPFIVKTATQEVTVLGTHFNINSYTDEPATKTTLLEGSVKIDAKGNNIILSPNQQATNTGHTIQVNKADPDLAIAWKNGEFMFRNEPLADIMKKIARWYDVKVIYENKSTGQINLNGSIKRFSKISEVLCMLELTGQMHFKVEGRRITVQ
ncbi:ferric-dicitrate binding protein FerR (iron transport regulator) [Pedobacter sp. AK017]|uniref:FecR family protein n=1 Tax=Pedobacter sp. AK017 TaxID=2723073 RepID=UPI0016227994|nr:FecR family protein [Pedobacter sp. AK017]MBB5437729.1 ferric-dicitrate binding protein FerR (iron transport regulator) [Pedobacter sp. AK017]